MESHCHLKAVHIGIFTVPHQSHKKKLRKKTQGPWKLLGSLYLALKEGWGGDRGPRKGLVASVPPEFAGHRRARWLQVLGTAEGLHGHTTRSCRTPCRGPWVPNLCGFAAERDPGRQSHRRGVLGHQRASGTPQPSATSETSGLCPRDWAGSGFWSSPSVGEPENVSYF